MFASQLALSVALAVMAPAAAAPDPVISEGCVLSAIRDQMVPASDSGVIVKLAVEQGERVSKGAELLRVDDREVQAQKIVKEKDYEVAQQNASSDVKIRYQEATAAVMLAGWRKLQAANKGGGTGTVPEIEVMRAELEYKKAQLGAEQAKEEHVTDQLTAEAKKAEVDAADVIVSRRILRAPFEGVVVQVVRREGEWVSPGDPVLQIVRTDRLRINATLPAADWGPADVEGRKVTVEVKLPQGRVEKVTGKVVFASPVVYEGELPIEAEIEAPIQNGRATVYAGLPAAMTIHVNQPVVAEKRPVAKPNEAPQQPVSTTTRKPVVPKQRPASEPAVTRTKAKSN